MAVPRIINIGQGNLETFIQGTRDGAEALTQRLAERGQELIDEAFALGGLPEDPWPPLSQTTLILRLDTPDYSSLTPQKSVRGAKVLVDTGKLSSSSFVEQIDDNEWVFGLSDPKAGIHEFGAVIEVTDKMRAYLHQRGVHLSPSKRTIIIPERSSIRSAAERLEQEYDSIYKETLGLLTRFKIKISEVFRWS